jgi:hypothetical protein
VGMNWTQLAPFRDRLRDLASRVNTERSARYQERLSLTHMHVLLVNKFSFCLLKKKKDTGQIFIWLLSPIIVSPKI